MKERTGWNTLPAVQQDHVFLFNSGIEYGPKSYIELAYTVKIQHPDLFHALDPHMMLNDYAARHVAGTNTTTTIYPELV
jgi:hypothetical protein